MTILHGSRVKTPNGEGVAFEYHGNGEWRVMLVNKGNFTGEISSPFTEKSPTVCKNYQESEMERI
jgi:hypothetical protein